MLPRMHTPSWAGIFAPAGIAEADLQRISVAAEQAIAQPEFEEALAKLGFGRAYEGGEAFRKYIEDQLDHYQKAAELAGLEPMDN